MDDNENHCDLIPQYSNYNHSNLKDDSSCIFDDILYVNSNFDYSLLHKKFNCIVFKDENKQTESEIIESTIPMDHKTYNNIINKYHNNTLLSCVFMRECKIVEPLFIVLKDIQLSALKISNLDCLFVNFITLNESNKRKYLEKYAEILISRVEKEMQEVNYKAQYKNFLLKAKDNMFNHFNCTRSMSLCMPTTVNTSNFDLTEEILDKNYDIKIDKHIKSRAVKISKTPFFKNQTNSELIALKTAFKDIIGIYESLKTCIEHKTYIILIGAWNCGWKQQSEIIKSLDEIKSPSSWAYFDRLNTNVTFFDLLNKFVFPFCNKITDSQIQSSEALLNVQLKKCRLDKKQWCFEKFQNSLNYSPEMLYMAFASLVNGKIYINSLNHDLQIENKTEDYSDTDYIFSCISSIFIKYANKPNELPNIENYKAYEKTILFNAIGDNTIFNKQIKFDNLTSKSVNLQSLPLAKKFSEKLAQINI
jgi:hypothetical protein